MLPVAFSFSALFSLFLFGFNSGVLDRVGEGEGVQRPKATLLGKRWAGEIGDWNEVLLGRYCRVRGWLQGSG